MTAADSLPILLSAVAVAISIASFLISRRHSIIEISHMIHSSLFEEDDIYQILYKFNHDTHGFYFDSNSRGAEGNFLGSDIERGVDKFLEKQNFICFWIMEEKIGNSRKIFEKYIERTARCPLIQQYLRFLSQAGSIEREGEYYPFLRKYIRNYTNIDIDSVSFSQSRYDRCA